MISKYEIHITTPQTLYELLNTLQSKGVGVDFIMKEGDSEELKIKFPSVSTIDTFGLKFYKFKDGMYTYELGGHSKECLVKMEEIANMIG